MRVHWARIERIVHAWPSRDGRYTLCGLRSETQEPANAGKVCAICRREVDRLGLQEVDAHERTI